ncbi:hypothetical protein BDW02DRAFT_644054 [Decorospora gaudefroyi]|uniref:Hyaluronan/mRNA-binding protein domain-containing protein n=1 Tax=Decorospora gaudefroyi TaxID=184978 RepID=A0A6A5KW55_9PLEO|nr:hypothetical protein BDW02DRAFT_644054 [Decorospora gaudefroyi]
MPRTPGMQLPWLELRANLLEFVVTLGSGLGRDIKRSSCQLPRLCKIRSREIHCAFLCQTNPNNLPPSHRSPSVAIAVTHGALQARSAVTRSHKFTDRDHAGIADGTAERDARLPKYFAKSGHADADPTKTKKGGSGKGNWGAAGDELEDIRPNMANARRRSNSSTHNTKDFKTKFETIETEPVFEEQLHGPVGEELEKQSTTSTDLSVADEDNDKKL